MHSSESLERRLLASAFFMEAGLWVVLVAVVLKILTLDGGALELGAALFLAGAGYLLLAPLARRLREQAGPFRVTRYGNLALILFATLAFQAPTLRRLVPLAPLLGFGALLYWPRAREIHRALAASGGAPQSDLAAACSAAAPPEAESVAGKEQARRRRFALAWSAGQSLGPLVCGLLLLREDFHSTFLAGIGLAALSFFSLPRDPEPFDGLVPASEQSAGRERELCRAVIGIGGGATLLQAAPLFAAAPRGALRFGIFLAAVHLVQTLILALPISRAWARRPQFALISTGLALLALPWMEHLGGMPLPVLLLGAGFGLRLAAPRPGGLEAARILSERAALGLLLLIFTLPGAALARASAWPGAPCILGGTLMLLSLTRCRSRGSAMRASRMRA